MTNPKRTFFFHAGCLALLGALNACAQTPRDFAIDLAATVSTSAPCITLGWSLRRPGNIAAQKIHRRLKGETAWVKLADLATNQTQYADLTATTAVEYEYWMERTYAGIYPATAMGYLSSGVNVPMAESRGTLLLVVDDTLIAPLAPEIEQLQADLAGEGWLVQPITAYRTNTPANVKAHIKAAYDADPANVKMVYLLGHVPVPYSGDMAPDGHADHIGAWPADGYYGEMDGTWTDSAVNNTSASSTRNDNIPGDGKFDQNVFPNLVELMVGRVDLKGMTRAPSPAVSEVSLLRRYLRRAHDFRMRQGAYASVPRRSMIRDAFGTFSGENFAIAGWGLAFTCVGQAPDAPIDEPANDQWFSGSYAGGQTYLFGYANGAGSYESASTVGHTADFGLKPSRVVFTSLFGSYFGDWDADNCFLRAPLAGNATADSLGLTCFWGGRPNHFLHHLGMGETAGYGMRASQNSSLPGGGAYAPYSHAGTHTALMGDPALRLYMVEPPRDLSALSSNSLVALAWSASTEANLLGYHVYRAATAAGPYARLTATPLTETFFTDSSATAGQSYSYLVRTLKRETVPGGTFHSLSGGAPITLAVSGGAAARPRNPSSLSVAPRSSTQAALAWTDNAANEAGFRIERRSNASGLFVPVGAVSANVTTYTDPGPFTNESVYYYRVVATNAAGDSPPCATVSFDAAAGFFSLLATRLKVDKSAGAAVLAINRFGGSNGVASVSFAMGDSSATAGAHYAATNGTLTWADGESGAKAIAVPVFNTAEPQAARQFELTLSSPSSGASLALQSSAAVLIEDPTATLAAPWSQALVGVVTDSSPAVTVSNLTGSVTIGGSGVAAAATADGGQFIYQNRTGDGILTAFFPAGQPPDSSARYALMVRASTASNAAMAATVTASSAAHGTKLISRSASGGSATAMPASANSLVLARWLRLTRSGNVFASETSDDGTTWTLLGSVTLASMPATALWGIFHYSSDWPVTGLGHYHLAGAQDVTLEDVPAPDTPAGLAATATSPTTVTLSWGTVANAYGYRVERHGESGGFVQIADLSAGAGATQTLTDAGLTPDTPYAYRVTAYNASGASAYSATLYITTAPPDHVDEQTTGGANGADAAVRLDVPDSPLGTATNLTVAGYDPDTWAVLTNAAKTYLRFDLEGVAAFEKATLELTFAGAERFDEAGFYNLYAYLLTDSSDLWNEGSLTWNNAPANSLAGVGFTEVAAVLGYTNAFAVPAPGERLSIDLNPSRLINGLGTNKILTIGLAQHSAGAIVHCASREHPSFAAPALKLSSRSTLPSRPSFLTASVNFGWSVTLRWQDSVSGETGFELERRLAGGAFEPLQTLASNTVIYLDAATAPATSYEYRLRATSASGASTWTPAVAITTPDLFHAAGTLWDAGGANTLISTPANWDTDVAPPFDGTTYLNFATAGTAATLNTPVHVLGLSLHRDADFTLSDGGATLTLGSGGVRAVAPSSASRTYTLAASVALAADQSWGITNAGESVTTLVVSGPVSDGASAFGIAKSGNGILTLAGDNSYDGLTSVASGGVLRVTHANGLGSTNGATTVASNAWLEVGGCASVPEPLTLRDASAGGALRSTDGTNAWAGRVTLAAPSRIRSLAGSRLSLAGGAAGAYDLFLTTESGAEIEVAEGALVTGSSRKVAADGAGTLLLGGSGHTFGTLEIAGGAAVRALAPDALPASTILSIGPDYGTSGTFDLNGHDVTVSQLKRGHTSAGQRLVTSATPATLTVSGSTSTTYDGILAGAVGLAKAGASTLTLSGTTNTYAGPTRVGGGTLYVTSASSLGCSSNVVITGGILRLQSASALAAGHALSIASPGRLRLDSGTATVSRLYLDGVRRGAGTWGSESSPADNTDNTYFDSLGTGVISVPYSPPGTVWDGGGADTRFDTPDNWDSDWPPAFDGTAYLRIGTGGNVATVNTNAAIRGLAINRDSDFTLAEGGGALSLGSGGLSAWTPSDVSRTYTLAARVALAADQAWGITNTGASVTTLVVSGPVSDGASAFGIAKSGNGILTLAGDNSYDGATSVASGGVLRVTHANGLGSTNGATTVASNAWLEVGGCASVPEPLTLRDASAGGALRSTDGTNAWAGRVTLAAPSRIRSLAGSRLSLAGGAAGAYDLFLTADIGAEIEVAGGALAIGASRKVAADGVGVLLLSGSGHTFGTLEIGGGATVRAMTPSALPASAILSIGPAYGTSGTFDLNGKSQTVSQLKRGHTSAGLRIVTSATPATLTVSGSTATTYDGLLTGAVGLTKAGASTLTLSGTTNTYTGGTTVSGGTLDVSSSSSLGNSKTVNVTGGTLRIRSAAAIADSAVLRIADGGAKVRIDAGTEDVGALYLGGNRQRRGTYGSSSSAAQHIDDDHFSPLGAGVINVLHGTETVLTIR